MLVTSVLFPDLTPIWLVAIALNSINQMAQHSSVCVCVCVWCVCMCVCMCVCVVCV